MFAHVIGSRLLYTSLLMHLHICMDVFYYPFQMKIGVDHGQCRRCIRIDKFRYNYLKWR